MSLTALRALDSILVRTYEDRSDLLRSLIIGPENTPYENAPFVIDWMLDANFPQTPPIAHFLSWTNGNGRGASIIRQMPPTGSRLTRLVSDSESELV